MSDNISFDQIRTDNSYNLIALYDDYETGIDSLDSPFQYGNSTCEYFEPDEFNVMTEKLHDSTTYFHLNCRGLSKNWESFRNLLCDLHGDKFAFDLIGVSEVFRCDYDTRLSLPGFHDLITRCRDDGSRGGVGLFIKENIIFKIREDLSVFIPHILESVFIEIQSKSNKNTIIGVIYRPNTAPMADVDIFSATISDILDTINKENKYGILMGDMNIDLLKFGSQVRTEDYLDSLFSHGFVPTITKPTRIGRSSATLIDHIYTNNISSYTLSGIIITDVADHFGTFFSIKNKSEPTRNKYSQTRFYTEHNLSKFKSYLDGTDFKNILQMECPNEAFNYFTMKYKAAFEVAFPLKSIKVNKKYIKREPWFTSGLLSSSRTRAKLLSKKLRDPTENNINLFKIYNNIFNKAKRSMKMNYYNDIIQKNKFNMKKKWSILRNIIGKQNDKSNFPPEFTIDGQLITNKSNIANAFNDYFSKIGLETSENVPSTSTNYTEYLPNPILHSMFIDPVTSSDVTYTVTKLKSKMSYGHDEISTKLLKQTITNIIDPITHIMNRSFITGIVPDQMKIAKVIPIFKTSDPSSINNYRPISLLTSFSKLLEKLMYDKVMFFLKSNDILYKHQYGFRAKHCTIHPIIHFLDHCAEANNKHNSEYTLAVFCDLSKAFDVINHKILLHKLNTYGIRGVVNTWFENYLSNRSQFVDIENFSSSRKHISCGVPQGSILGPLLFLVYVNDISTSCGSNVLSFADDTTLYVSHSDLGALYDIANTEINKLYTWFCANKLSLNAKKTKYIVIRPKHKASTFANKHILINGIPLNRIGNHCADSSIKFLGISIDEHLSWQKHLSQVNSKIARAMFAIRQVKHILSRDILRNLYFALIHPHLSYGILVWGNAKQTILSKTKTLQKRAIRTINKAAFNSHTDPLFRSSQILKLDDLYHYTSSLFMFDYVNRNLPRSFDNVFPLNRDVQFNKETRQSNLMYIQRCPSCFSSNLPLYSLPQVWNKWSNLASGVTSRGQFKKLVKSSLLLSYPNQVKKCLNKYCPDCH